MDIESYNYHLPKERIAQRPANPRTHSKLMIVSKEPFKIEHKKFFEIINYFEKGDVLVLNQTKVMKIKLEGKKNTGGEIELMLENENEKGKKISAIIKGKINQFEEIFFEKNIKARVLEKKDNKVYLEFNLEIREVIKKIGKLPTPPYIKKEIKKESEYQNVFANKSGSLACPTAGLHFDKNLLEKIKGKGVKIAFVCLHVSWDTFLPICEKDFLKHKMHGEECEIEKKNAEIINKGKRVFVVGTTALRTLESFAKKGKIIPGKKKTEIFIYPGYKFNFNYSGLITNFHFPKSTLLLMISAFFGKDKIFEAYEIAIKKKYRFFSLGDAMFLKKD